MTRVPSMPGAPEEVPPEELAVETHPAAALNGVLSNESAPSEPSSSAGSLEEFFDPSPEDAVPSKAMEEADVTTGLETGSAADVRAEPEAAGGPNPTAPDAESGASALGNTIALSPSVPPPILSLAGISPELVALQAHTNGAMACYAGVAGTVLGSPWRRTSLFFTSPGAEHGATAINVATALSHRAEGVLLVDLNLTAPSIWPLLGRPPLPVGLEEALRKRASCEDCVARIAGERLSLLLTKQAMTLDEAERLSGALNDFLEWAEERFAWLVVDCPPVLGPAWTRWFQLNADPVVLVARRDKTRKHELRMAAKLLEERLMGTILNCQQP